MNAVGIKHFHLRFLYVGTLISIAFFNFAGVSVTKEMSATTRMVLDSVRTVVIWTFSLAFLGQAFHWLQVSSKDYLFSLHKI